jgi:Fic family protein
MNSRRYQETHPWIDFRYEARLDEVSALLGEAYSKCQHLAGTPLQPGLAQSLSNVYLVRGAVATTAIEGNTLTEQEVMALREQHRSLPTSQRYLQQEVDNVIAALEAIDRGVLSGEKFRLTPEWIAEQNERILAGLDLPEHVRPGEYTTSQLTVGGGFYRPVSPEDVPYLVLRLCEWLEEMRAPLDNPATPPHHRFMVSFCTAVLGHLYLAWIHPFGDGNGRTARMLECALLANSGVVPWVSANLLSDHYNRTRSRYYEMLDRASRAREVRGFVAYSVQGFVDMMRGQIEDVQAMQRRVAWINYVHEQFQEEPSGPTRERRRLLTLTLPEDRPTSRREIRHLSPQLAEMYAGKEDKTVTRDLNRLLELRLIGRHQAGYRALVEVMDAFMPATSS